MGQYHIIINFDKKEYLVSDRGDKLFDWIYSNSNMTLNLLYKLYKEWKGDRVFVVGDYAESRNPVKEEFGEILKSLEDEFHINNNNESNDSSSNEESTDEPNSNSENESENDSSSNEESTDEPNSNSENESENDSSSNEESTDEPNSNSENESENDSSSNEESTDEPKSNSENESENKCYTLYELAKTHFKKIPLKKNLNVNTFNYVYNHDLKTYVDLKDVPRTYRGNDEQSSLSPLVLLLTLSSGMGSGDYQNTYYNYDLVGSWTQTVRSLEVTKEKKGNNYKRFRPNFLTVKNDSEYFLKLGVLQLENTMLNNGVTNFPFLRKRGFEEEVQSIDEERRKKIREALTNY